MKFKPYLIPLYAAATLFARGLSFPWLPDTVQLTEVIFVFALWFFRREVITQIRRYRWFSAAVGVYLFGNIVAALVASSQDALIEAMARVYLAVVAYIVLAHVDRYGAAIVASWWRVSTIAVATACILISTGVLVGLPDPGGWTSYVPDYPIFGPVYRLAGTATVYGMMYMLLLPGMVLAYERFREGRGGAFGLLVILLAGSLTIAKENLLFPMAVLLLEAGRRYRNFRWPLRIGAIGLGVILLVNTHFLLMPADRDLTDNIFTSGRTVYTGAEHVIAETNYLANKRAGLLIGSDHPWFGVGPGRFQDYTEALVPSGNYPAHFSRVNPHSAWTGAFAETGLLGLLGLCALVASLWFYRPEQWTVPAVLLLLFLVASIFKDVMNFRGLWVLVGLYLVRCGDMHNLHSSGGYTSSCGS